MKKINWNWCCIFILLLSAVGYDLKNYRIPNLLIGIGLLISFLQCLLERSFSGIIIWGVGVFTPILILSPLFLWRVLGAGDIKLFSVIGSFLGGSAVIPIIVTSFLIGGVLSLIHMILFRSFFKRIRYFLHYISDVVQSKQYKPYVTDLLPEYGSVIHFTAAIFLGTLITMLKNL